ncbi:Fe-S-containing hydro-lyase [Chloroflexota bacterium]
MVRKITLPLTDETLDELKAGDSIIITGVIYTARDAAHRRMVEALEQGKPLPFDIKGQTVYYMGPSPARPGQVIGSAGPTTSGRMDAYTPRLLAEGLKGMIGKGMRSETVKDAMIKHKAVYFAAVGGTGALISKSIKKSEIIAYEELGPEAVLCLDVEDLPVTVAVDVHGGDIYQDGRARYRMD